MSSNRCDKLLVAACMQSSDDASRCKCDGGQLDASQWSAPERSAFCQAAKGMNLTAATFPQVAELCPASSTRNDDPQRVSAALSYGDAPPAPPV